MKVLFHIPFNVVGGAETQIGYLLKELRGLISPLVTYEYPDVEKFVMSLGVPYERVYSPSSLSKVMTQFYPHVTQFYHSHNMYAALKRYRGQGMKVVEILHNRFPFPGDASSYPKDHTHVCVGVSPDAADNFMRNCPGTRTVVIPNGIDTSVFNPDLRRGFVPNKRRTGGFTGRLEEGDGKGIPALLRVARACPDVDFELVGRDFGGYQGICSKEGLTNVRFYPHAGDVSGFYARWDFFISMSPAEGFGLSIAEAYHCGMPTLTLDCGGVCSLLAPNDVTLVRSEGEMVAAVKGELMAPAGATDLSSRAMAKSYLHLYKSLLADSVSSTPAHPTRRAEKTDTLVGLCPSDWYGVKRSLQGYCSEVTTPQLAKSRLRRSIPRAVVFGCYSPQWEDVLLEARRLGCKTVLTWHASYILNEFDHTNREWMWHALRAARAGLFDYVVTTHQGLANTWTRFGVKTAFLPNVIDKVPEPAVSKRPGINIGILGSGQPWKNVECQVIAASMVPGATVHVQGLRHPQSIESLGIQYKRIPHMPSDAEYFRFMGEMSVNMVVSLSETYSYFAAESMLLGTPIITTPITPVTQGCPALEPCITPHFEDPEEISRVIERVLNKNNYESIRKAGIDWMVSLNEKNKQIVKEVTASWV